MSLLRLSVMEGRLYQVAASAPSIAVGSQRQNEKLDAEIHLQKKCLLYMYMGGREREREREGEKRRERTFCEPPRRTKSDLGSVLDPHLV